MIWSICMVNRLFGRLDISAGSPHYSYLTKTLAYFTNGQFHGLDLTYAYVFILKIFLKAIKLLNKSEQSKEQLKDEFYLTATYLEHKRLQAMISQLIRNSQSI